MSKASVFISYSHKDEIWKDRLLTHLKVFEEEGLLETWDDRRIGAGADWLPTIEQAMVSAKVAILLISADFLISEFIRRKEVPTLLERRETEGLCIFPVIVRACVWKKVPWLARLQARPLDGKPLADRRGARIETHLAEIAAEVWDLIQSTTGPGEEIPIKDPAFLESSSHPPSKEDLLVAPTEEKLDPSPDLSLERRASLEAETNSSMVMHSKLPLAELSSELVNEPQDAIQMSTQGKGTGFKFSSPDTQPSETSSDQLEASSLTVHKHVEEATPKQYADWRRVLKYSNPKILYKSIKDSKHRIIYIWGLVVLFAISTMAVIEEVQQKNYFNVKSPAYQAPPDQDVVPPPRTATEPSTKPLTVTIDFKSDCWVEASIDNKQRVAELRIQGESLSLEAQKSVALTLGNAGVVDVRVNGYGLPLNKKEGEVVKDLVIDLDTVKKLKAQWQ